METSTTAAPLIDEDLQLDTPLWNFALRLWQDRHTATLCLELQAAGWSVTRLLCASWLAWEGQQYRQEAARVTEWRRRMTAPLRAMRQALARESTTTAGLREQLARAELEAERIELALAYDALASSANTPENCLQHQPLAQRLQANLLKAGPNAEPMDRTTQAMIQRLSRQLTQQLAAPMEATP